MNIRPESLQMAILALFHDGSYKNYHENGHSHGGLNDKLALKSASQHLETTVRILTALVLTTVLNRRENVFHDS